MVKRQELISWIDNFLKIDKFDDISFNGLQVEGKEEVNLICTSVSCNLRFFKEAKKRGADLLITHHGLLWEKRWSFIRGVQKERIKFLLANEINLASYHLPLDAHPEVGNNAQGLIKLGAKIQGTFGSYHGQDIGYWGTLKSKVSLAKLTQEVNKVFGAKTHVADYGKTMVEKIAFVSGSGRMFLEEAIEKGMDVYLSGESNESAPAMAQEGQINFLSSGHYNTEKLGVMALGELLADKFKIKFEFVDIPNSL